MEKIARKLTDLVGNTPLLELSNYNTSNDLKARLIVKIESFNPAGSVKDRIALAMIEDAERKEFCIPEQLSLNRPVEIPVWDWLLFQLLKAIN